MQVRLLPAFLFGVVLCAGERVRLPAQDHQGGGAYSRANTVAFYTDLGFSGVGLNERANDRKLLDFGIRYEHRFWKTRLIEFHYAAEFAPVVLLRNTRETQTLIYMDHGQSSESSFASLVATCAPGTGTQMFPNPTDGSTVTLTQETTCGHEWSYAQAFAPAGFIWKFRRGKRLQPIAGWTGGMLLATKPVPEDDAGSFNFTYQFGIGMEYYTAAKHSVTLRYDLHHYSNAGTATRNPGVDNGVVRLSYSFGR